MATGLPINIPVPSEPVLVSYNFTDIADGTGVVTLYGFTTEDTGGIAYNLGTESVRSATISTGEGTYTFDMKPFNTPRIAKGTAILSITIGVPNTNQGKLTAKISNATQAVDITSVITSPTFAGTPAPATAKSYLLKLPITQHSFRIGDVLRLTIVLTHVAGGDAVEIGHDPQNRDGAYIVPATYSAHTTVMKLNMPFKVDL